MSTRRKFIENCLTAAAGIGVMSGKAFSVTHSQWDDIYEKAKKIHKNALTLDSHCDTPMFLVRDKFDITQKNTSRARAFKVDFPRMQEGKMDAMYFAVFIGQGPRTPEGNKQAHELTAKIFHAIHQTVKDNGKIVQLAYSADEIVKSVNQNKLTLCIGIENGYAIGNDLNLIKKYYDLGARYITLCHSSNNDICDSSTDDSGPEHNGVSDFGKKVIQEMNRLGIIVDTSHVSDKSFYDAAKLSSTPVIASHSCARAVCEHPRNMTDDMLKRLAEVNGVIQMCILSRYVKNVSQSPERTEARDAFRKKYSNYNELSPEEKEKAWKEWYAIDDKYPPKLATVADFVDHIDHVVQLIGIDHVGIGTDFDGGGALEDCYDVSEIGNITLELVKRGYSKKDINKIWSGNFLRVLREVEQNRL